MQIVSVHANAYLCMYTHIESALLTRLVAAVYIELERIRLQCDLKKRKYIITYVWVNPPKKKKI